MYRATRPSTAASHTAMRSHPSTSNLLEHESLSVAVTESTSVMDAASCDGCGWESLRQHREVQSRPPSRVVGQTSALPVRSRVSCPDSVLRKYRMTSHCNDGSSASVSCATGVYGSMTRAAAAAECLGCMSGKCLPSTGNDNETDCRLCAEGAYRLLVRLYDKTVQRAPTPPRRASIQHQRCRVRRIHVLYLGRGEEYRRMSTV
jgi:hypothetical protein